MREVVVTVHGIVTLLYAAPVPDTELRAAEVSALARYIELVHLSVPASQRECLEAGMAVLAARGGPLFDPARYRLAQDRANAVTALAVAR